MSTTVVRRLPDLAAEINREHALCERGYRAALEHALKVGALLIEAKGQVSHGAWLPWLAEHTHVSAQTAQRYMRLTEYPNASALTHLGIEEALHAIAKPAAKPPAGDLRTALRGADQADVQAALAELGPMRVVEGFPSSPMERTTWRQIAEALARVRRAMDEGSADGLSKWSRREALHEASRHARNAASQLSELADSLAS